MDTIIRENPDNEYVYFEKVSENKPGLVPVGHWVQGLLKAPVVKGESVYALRFSHKIYPPDEENKQSLGNFNTSRVEDIEQINENEFLLKTRNSEWKIEFRKLIKFEDVKV